MQPCENWRMLPGRGTWFPEEALQLASDATPALEEIGAPETAVRRPPKTRVPQRGAEDVGRLS